jgi:hypothetical protein
VYNKPISGPLGSTSAEGKGNPQWNARRGDAVEMAENIANGRNMSERPVSEWMARTGYAARGKSGFAG